MDQLTIENFRCFRKRETARLAPLTILVGENSTGKTSFLAMTRILWNIYFEDEYKPDFKEAPYDLGSFRELVHRSGNEDGPPPEFSAGFGVRDWSFFASFSQGRISTQVVKLTASNSSGSVTVRRLPGTDAQVEVAIGNGRWRSGEVDERTARRGEFRRRDSEFWGLFTSIEHLRRGLLVPDRGSRKFKSQDEAVMRNLVFAASDELYSANGEDTGISPPAATSPVRSRPERTYDPGFAALDPEGANAPAFLAALAQFDKGQWKRLNAKLEKFGQLTGLFDQIRIRPLGNLMGSDPFQVQVRKWTKRGKGAWRNLIDVGYGVSQMLPVMVELGRSRAPRMLLLQQPEVHLHPSAQAGLGSILCIAAAQGRQILVETHSDYLIDRVRMDVRDRKSSLQPEDVSILFFERDNEDVNIHNLRIDREGNIVGSPPAYGRFFMDEVNRSLGI